MRTRCLLAPALAAGALLMAALSAPAHAQTLTATDATIAGATLNAQSPTSSSPPGVSPEVFYDSRTGTYTLLTTHQPAIQYTSRDGQSWTPTAVQLPEGGIDWSIVEMAPNNYRLYYAELLPSPGGPPQPCVPGSKRLRYATSSDLQSWTVQPQVLLPDVGCGVPHVMKTKDGRFLLYQNMRNPDHGIYTATSPDGLAWSLRSGILANNGELVDPAPLEMPDGTFLMVTSTVGRTGFQELQLLRSSDGLTWTARPTTLYRVAGSSVLDPSIELIDGNLRVWFGQAVGGDHNASRITHGTLTLGATAPAGSTTTGSTGGASAAAAGGAVKGKPCPKKGATSGSLICAKVGGRLVWKAR